MGLTCINNTTSKLLETKRLAFQRGKSATSIEAESTGSPSECGEFLHIGPALSKPGKPQNNFSKQELGPRAYTTLSNCHFKNVTNMENGCKATLPLQTEGHLQIARSHKEKEKSVDRISLDRRGLTCVPAVIGEPGLRLLSLQHNLLNSLNGLSSTIDFSSLVFLDVYDNQIDKISSLEGLFNLRVLLMGKNRIRRIEGLSNVIKLEVLDLHGNRITQANGLKGLNELKVLNLAGNQLRCVELSGLPELRELNLKRNRLRKLLGCEGVPKIQKLFLSNNDLQSIDDISSVAMALSLREVTLDNNPVSLGGDCISFLVSYLPNICFLSQMQVTDQVRRAAMAWRHNKETCNAAYGDLGKEIDVNARREQIISNARTNWELLRSQNKSMMSVVTQCTNIGFTPEYVPEPNNMIKSDAQETFKNNSLMQLNRSQFNVNYKCDISPQLPKNYLTALSSNGISNKQGIVANRSISQDTDVSHSTSTSSELLKLPPILVPIIDSIEHQKINVGNDTSNHTSESVGIKYFKRWESISSVDPILNSSMSSLLTTSDSESDVSKKLTNKAISTATKKRATFAASKSVSVSESNSNSVKTWPKNRSISDNSENTSVMSAGTNVNSTMTNSSTSGSDITRPNHKENSNKTGSGKGRHIKSATTVRRNLAKHMHSRAVTAKPKQSKNNVENNANVVIPTEPVIKDREQGSDWLIEVRSGQASVWGAGALRRLERVWPGANEVTTIHFHYVSFTSICSVLLTIKNRFPNAVNLTFRACGISYIGQLGALAELRGISSLTIHKEGNPLAGQSWQSYALYRLAHWGLCSLDSTQITDKEICNANEEYAGLSEVVLWSLPDSLLQPLLVRSQGEKDGNSSKPPNERDCKSFQLKDGFHRKFYDKENITTRYNDKDNPNNFSDPEGDLSKFGVARCWLWNADSTLRDVVAKEALQWRRTVMSQEEVVLRHRGRAHLSKILCFAAGAALKLKLLRRHWPAILLHLLTNILHDFSQLQSHVEEKMRELQSDMCIEDIKKN